MPFKTIKTSKEEYERLKSLDIFVDWEVVEGFKQGLEDLRSDNVEEFKKGSLLN